MARKRYVRSLSLFLALLMIFSLFPVQSIAYAAEEVPTEITLVPADEPGTAGGTEDAASDEGSEEPLLSATLTEETEPQASEESADIEQNTGSEETGETETSEATQTVTEPTEQTPTDTTQDVQESDNTPTENPPAGGNGEGGNQHADVTPSDPEESAEGSGEPAEGSGEPVIDKSKRGVDFQFYKSDVQYNSWYYLHMLSPMVPDTTPFGSLLNSEITLDSICRINEQDAVNAFDHVWFADSEKSINGMLPEKVLETIGAWNINANFTVRTFILSQNEQDIAQYFLFLFQENGSELIRYALISSNMQMELRDLTILFDQYAAYRDYPVFVESEDLNHDEIVVLRDVFRENLECIAFGAMPAADFSKVNVDLAGPQLVIVPEEGGEAGGEGTEQGTEPGTEPGNENPTEPGTETPTEPGTENPTEPSSETPTEPSTENPTEPSSETPAETGAGTNDGTNTEDPKEPGETPTGETTTGESGETPLEGDDNQKKEPAGETDGDNTSDQTDSATETIEKLDVPEFTVEEIQEAISEVEHGETMQEASEEELLSDDQLLPETLGLMRLGMRKAPEVRLTGAPVQEPVTADGITIERINMRWLSHSTGSTEKAGFDPLVLAPENDIFPNQQWQIDFSLSGSGTVDPGAIEIVIPAWIWKDRNGNEPGRLTLAIPEEPDTSNDFAWKRVGDTYVITNTHALQATSKYMIQGTFRNTWPDPNSDQPFDTTYAHQMVDQGYEGGDQPYTGISDDFYAVMNVVTPRTGEVLTMTSNSIHATIDTYVEVASATMTVVDNKAIFDSVPSEIPSKLLPDNPNDYFYVQWYVDGRIKGCQPFSMDFDFNPGTVSKLNPDTGEFEPADVHSVVLGATYTADGTVPSENGATVQGKLYEGFSTADKSAYVWVAYPKSEFPGEGVSYRIDSHNTVSATGLDDGNVSTATANGSLSFRTPIIWKIKIEWIDDDNAKGRRPGSANVWVENKSIYGSPTVIRGSLSDSNEWYLEYVDDGTLANYEAYEYSYQITRSNAYYIVEGDDGWEEFDNGSKVRWKWWYSREKTVYDEATHTWTFYNYYHEANDWAWLAMLYLGKFATSHQNNNPKATSDTELQWLRRGEDTDELLYRIDCSSYALPYTMAEDGRPSDVSSHFARYVDLEAVDHDPYFQGRKLEEDEYDITYIVPQEPIIKNWQPAGGEDETKGNLIDAPFVPMKLYGYVNGEWIQFGEWKETGLEPMNGAWLRWGNLYFPGDGVKRVKSIMHFNNAYAEMHYKVCMILHSSEAIRQSVEEIFAASDYGMGRCFNYGTTTLSDASGNTIMTLTRHDPSYLHGRNYRMAADLDKEVEFVSSDMANRVMRFTNRVTLTQGSNVTDYMEFRNAYFMGDLQSTSAGTFYDLLPPGMTVDLDTVAIDSGSIKTVDLIDNYQGSGSQLLKVSVKLGNNFSFRAEGTSDAHYGDDTYPVSGYANKNTLSFDMLYTYDEAEYRGMEGLRNHAAFEASGSSLGNQPYWTGEPDDPTVGNNKESNGAISNAVLNLMTNLDPDRDDPTFVYAGAIVPISELNFWAMTDIRKHVQVSGGSRWSYGLENDVNVYEGGKYTYKLQVTSGVDTTTKDIYILDSLENYRLTADDPDYNAAGQWSWQGSFLGVDVSEMEALGAAPVIYYNTSSNLDFSTANPDKISTVIPAMLQGNGWTTEMPDDPASVRAIAIDCSKDKNGNSFELPENMAVIAYVSMRAPTWFSNPEAFDSTEYQDFLKNAHAYNNAFVDFTQVDEFGVPSHAYNHSGYTKTGIIGSDLEVEKIWEDMDDNDRLRPNETTVYLFADEEDTGRSLILNADNEWSGVFEHIRKYDDDGNQIYYELRDEIEGYECASTMADNKVTLVNTHEPKTIEVPFTKDWDSDEPDGWQSAIPSSITVRLYCNGEYTGKSMTVRKAPNGSWTGKFEGLLKYDQGLENVYTIVEDDVENFIPTIDGYAITNTYYPFGDLIVRKHVLNGTSSSLSTSFKFTLQLADNEGNGLPGKFNYTIYNVEDAVESTGVIGNGDEFYLKDGWRMEVKDIPSGNRYSVMEDNAPGFTLTGNVDTSGRIRSSRPAEADFTNTYNSMGMVSVNAEKTLVGRELDRYQFQFRIYDEEGNVVRAAANQKDGSVTFGAIRYTQADDGKEFVYTLKETATDKTGYTYDDTVYTVKVQVQDNGRGKMICDMHYFNVDNEPVLMPTFTNEYHAEGDLTLRAWKVLPQRQLQENEFEFELLDEENNVVGTVRNTADGSVIFDPIHFTEEDVDKKLYYFVREKKGSDATVIYDESVYGYEVQALDNGDGTLSFSQSFVDTSNRFLPCNDCESTGYVTTDDDSAFIEGGGEVRVTLDRNNNVIVPVYVDWLQIGLNDSHLVAGESYTITSPAGRTYSGTCSEMGSISLQQVPVNDVFSTGPWIMTLGNGEVYKSVRSDVPATALAMYEEAISGSTGFTTVFTDENVAAGMWDQNGWQIRTNETDEKEIVFNLTLGSLAFVPADFCPTCEGSGSVINPDWEPIATEQLPVFTNTLKPGTLSLTKQVTADDLSLIDPTQEFHFKVKLIGPDVQDGEMEYDLEQVDPYQATP